MSAASSKRSGFLRVLLSVLTLLVIVAAFCGLVFIGRVNIAVDNGESANGNATSQVVSPSRIQMYCPSPMTLADSGSYGDSAYQASEGNLSSNARYAAFGSVYSTTLTSFPANDDAAVTLNADNGVHTAAQNSPNIAKLMDIGMLAANEGAGATGTLASSADDGDLRGVSASTCTPTALTRSFLLASTQTGTTQQLVVANPSAKSTSVDITAYGSSSAGALTLAAHATLAIQAQSESVLDLSAAVGAQDGAYVVVSSKQTPIAAVVRTVTMDGLTPKGSDFAMPLDEPQASSAVAGVQKDDAVTAYLFAESNTKVELSWITSGGLVHAKDVELTGDQVSVVDLGKAPDKTQGVMAIAEDAVSMSVKASRSGKDDQADFALITASTAIKQSAVALPEGFTGSLIVANTSNESHKVTVQGYGADGKSTQSKTVDLGANAAQSIAMKDLGSAAYATLQDDSSSVVLSLRLTKDNLGGGDVAGLAVVNASSLMPQQVQVWSRATENIVK